MVLLDAIYHIISWLEFCTHVKLNLKVKNCKKENVYDYVYIMFDFVSLSRFSFLNLLLSLLTWHSPEVQREPSLELHISFIHHYHALYFYYMLMVDFELKLNVYYLITLTYLEARCIVRVQYCNSDWSFDLFFVYRGTVTECSLFYSVIKITTVLKVCTVFFLVFFLTIWQMFVHKKFYWGFKLKLCEQVLSNFYYISSLIFARANFIRFLISKNNGCSNKS